MVLWKEIRTNPTLEKKMSKFVSLLKRDLFEKADTLLFNSLRLQKFDHIDHIYPWPWKGTKNRINLAKKDRISLYKILKPMLLETDTKLLMDLILFQLRCNEALQLFRKGKFEESKKIFNVLSYTRHLYNDNTLIHFRRDFRENIKDMSIQLFDISIMYYYMGMISFNLGDFEQAIGDADYSILYCEGAHYLDECAPYILLSNSYYEQQKFKDAIDTQMEVNEIALMNNDQQLIGISYYNLCNIDIQIFKFDKALDYASKYYDICIEMNNSGYIQNSLMLLAKVYQHLKNVNRAIEYYIHSLNWLNKENNYNAFTHIYILHNLILQYNKKQDFHSSIIYLNEMEKINDLDFIYQSRMLILLSRVDTAISMYSLPENNDIEEIITLLENPNLKLDEKRTALILLSIVDLQNADNIIYNQLKTTNLISQYMENTIFPPFVCYQILKEIEMGKNESKIKIWIEKINLFLKKVENKLDDSKILSFMNVLHKSSLDKLQELVIEISKEYLQNSYDKIENYKEISY